jgi:hypothetical protein
MCKHSQIKICSQIQSLAQVKLSACFPLFFAVLSTLLPRLASRNNLELEYRWNLSGMSAGTRRIRLVELEVLHVLLS